MSSRITIESVNKLSPAEFTKKFINVVELWPQAAVDAELKRPFSSHSKLVKCFHDYLQQIEEKTKVAILRSHPDLAGKMADENKLSDESAREQAIAGLNQLDKNQKMELRSLNYDYLQKFDFPFIICVRQNNKFEAILEGIKQRLPNDRSTEIRNAIDEVKKICEIRINDIVDD